MRKTLILLTLLNVFYYVDAQERYTDFDKASQDFKSGKISPNRFPNSGYDRMQFENYFKERIGKKYLGWINSMISYQTNSGKGGVIFNYETSFKKDRDFINTITYISGPIKSVESGTDENNRNVLERHQNKNETIPDSLYVGKIFFEGVSPFSGKEVSEKLVMDIYNGKVEIGDTLDLGMLTFNCKLNTEIGDTIWTYDQSKTGYPDNKKFIQLYGEEVLKDEKKWRELIPLEEFKKTHIKPLSKFDTKSFKLKHNVKVIFKKSYGDSLNIEFGLLIGKYDKQTKEYTMKFESDFQKIYNNQPSWYMATSRDINVLYNTFISNCVSQFKRELMIDQKKEEEDKRLEAQKQELIKKYGKANVDSAYMFTPRVGMPEDLLLLVLKMWTPERKTEFVRGYTIYCKGVLDTSEYLAITVENGKVVRYWSY